jgi:hypothetical protein
MVTNKDLQIKTYHNFIITTNITILYQKCWNKCNHIFLQDDIITTLSSISSSLHGLFTNFATSPAFVCLDSDLIRLQRETETLCKNTEFLISSQLHGAHQGDLIKVKLFSSADKMDIEDELHYCVVADSDA